MLGVNYVDNKYNENSVIRISSGFKLKISVIYFIDVN